MNRFSALILAGSRPGGDPVARAEGLGAKALVDVAGQAMLSRVIAAVREAGADRIGVVASDPDTIALAEAQGCVIIPAASGPSESAARGFAALGAPMLLTTSDHPLLQAQWIEDFRQTVQPTSDVAVLLARRDVVEAAVPQTQRTWLRFADGEWSGCNLFLFRTPAAAAGFALWQAVERERKRPWRIVRRLGPALLLRYLAGRLSLADAVAHLGRKAGVVVEAVATPHGLAAVDVDKVEDLALVRQILSR